MLLLNPPCKRTGRRCEASFLPKLLSSIHFRFAFKEFRAPRLASMLDSLVRVSRRVGCRHFASDRPDGRAAASPPDEERFQYRRSVGERPPRTCATRRLPSPRCHHPEIRTSPEALRTSNRKAYDLRTRGTRSKAPPLRSRASARPHAGTPRPGATRVYPSYPVRPRGSPLGTSGGGARRESDETLRSPSESAFLVTISSSFHPLFRVLFTFPSQYFCAIGFVAIFSFGWDQPPVLGLQSQTTRLEETGTPIAFLPIQGFHLLGRAFRGDFSDR